MNNGYKLSAIQMERIWALHKQGVESKYIAERFDVSSGTINRVIRMKRETVEG